MLNCIENVRVKALRVSLTRMKNCDLLNVRIEHTYVERMILEIDSFDSAFKELIIRLESGI